MAVITQTFTNEMMSGSTEGIQSQDASNSYANARNGASSLILVNNEGTDGVRQIKSGVTFAINRYWFHFDTSALPGSGEIVSAFLRIPGAGAAVNDDTDGVGVVDSTVSSNTVLLTSDWGNVGSTAYSTINLSSWSAAGNNDFALDATGLTKIIKGGHTKFALRMTRDISNNAPTGNNNAFFTLTGLLLSVTYQTSTSDERSYLM